MARVMEQIVAVKLSRIVKDSDDRDHVIDAESMELLKNSIPELAESVLNDTSVVVEVMELE